jgi:hypothetical protein
LACGAVAGTKMTLSSPETAAIPERELAALPVEAQKTVP